MATIVIDGKEYPLVDGESLNVIQAATRVGVETPYFCWYPAPSVVANCRMCEVGSKNPETGDTMPSSLPSTRSWRRPAFPP